MDDPGTARAPRRTDALSGERIVAAAIEVLDSVGEDGLTVRGLTAHLATGRGAIYHHVSGRAELLASAADSVVGRMVDGLPDEAEPDAAVRALALGIFDAIDAHPWLGTQLVRQPHQPAVLRIWTAVGSRLARLGIDGARRADAGAALVGYILGSTAQYVAGPRRQADDGARQAYLDRLASVWTEHDPDADVAEAARRLRAHDDRAQFLAGVDIVLAGVAPLASGRPAPDDRSLGLA